MERTELPRVENFSAGSLIGTFVGDALGMPVEGWSHRRIRDRYGRVDQMMDARLGAGTYTDDTQMALATARSLVENDGVDREKIAESFLDYYDSKRGYGRGTVMVFEKWQQGKDMDRAAEEIYDGGSFGNGGSMRIAPVGVWCSENPDSLVEAVEAACGLTHAHPLGKGSSFLQAYSVAKAFRADPDSDLDTMRWIQELIDVLPDRLDVDGVLRSKMETVRGYLAENSGAVDPGRVARDPGCSSKAFESVPAAVYSFLAHPNQFREAVTYAVGIGGDTDTIGAMTGAISGAYHGVTAVPEQWWSRLENGQDGRDEILVLACRLVRDRD